MSDSIWPTIHAQRAALADDLAGLDDAGWATPSLCERWSVADVLAHALAGALMTPPRFLARFARARFDFDRFAESEVTLRGADGPAATLEAFRAAQHRTSAPPGPKAGWLGEAFVHGEDIRRPLGIHRDYPVDQVARALEFYAGSEPIVHGRSRVAGLTLRATDTDLTLGDGPEVEGPVIALLVATSGRRAGLADLSGPGVDVLDGRLTRTAPDSFRTGG